MDTVWKRPVWQQFGAAIDMLGHAIDACPDVLWRANLWEDPDDEPPYNEFWFITYHVLYWLDLYLSGSVEAFTPPERFKRDENAPNRGLPQTPYTKEELQSYLSYCREKCYTTIAALTDETAQRPCHFEWLGDEEFSFLELLLYNLRHVQEHAAQLSLVIGQNGYEAPDWVPKAEDGEVK